MSLESRLAAFISAVGADIKSLQAGSAAVLPSVPWPDEYGFKTWTYDPAIPSTSVLVPTAGQLNVILLKNRSSSAITLSSLTVYCGVAGATLTNVGFALYDYAASGALRASSVNANGATAAAFQAVGAKTITFATPVTIPAQGKIYGGFWFTGTTMPSLLRTSGSGPALNIGTVSPLWRWGLNASGLTTAAPATLGAATIGGSAWWMAAA